MKINVRTRHTGVNGLISLSNSFNTPKRITKPNKKQLDIDLYPMRERFVFGFLLLLGYVFQ